MKIGVFDSGVGGQSVANAIKKALPGHEIIYRHDRDNVPYGGKTPEQLLPLVIPILQSLVDDSCQIIVIACNTVTTTVINELRVAVSVPLIGMEPMVKPAVELTKTNTIAVCATPATLFSQRYSWLKSTYAQNINILEPDCSDWSFMIESDRIDRQKIHDRIDEVCRLGADVIVLGCTHYHWIEDIIIDVAAGRAKVLQPELPVIEQLKRVMQRLV